MWPPVPPPAISRRMSDSIVAAGRIGVRLLAGFECLTGDREEDADGREAHDERRAAGTDERQRDARDGQQRDDDPDVDEGLEAQPDRDPGGQQGPERVGRATGRPDPGVAKDEEQGDDDAGPDEPELLADDREDEVV